MEITPGYEIVDIAMDPSGSVEARIGAAPHGQGLHTSLSQIIADELSIDPERIRIVHGDTDRTPYGWGTFASRSIVICGGAAEMAAAKLGTQIAMLAGHLLQADVADIVLADGRASVRDQDASIEIAELARLVHYQSHQFSGDAYAKLSARATYDPAGTYSNGCHAAIVRGRRRNGDRSASRRFVAVEDAGRLINPMIADGQIRGGITQGIANALYERIIYDKDGNIFDDLADGLSGAERSRGSRHRDRSPGNHHGCLGDRRERPRRRWRHRRAGRHREAPCPMRWRRLVPTCSKCRSRPSASAS